MISSLVTFHHIINPRYQTEFFGRLFEKHQRTPLKNDLEKNTKGHHSKMTLNMPCLCEFLSETKPACVFNNVEYNDGDMFRMDNCRFCRCQGGVSICFTAQCGELTCERYYVPEGECCPVCEGKTGANWRLIRIFVARSFYIKIDLIWSHLKIENYWLLKEFFFFFFLMTFWSIF